MPRYALTHSRAPACPELQLFPSCPYLPSSEWGETLSIYSFHEITLKSVIFPSFFCKYSVRISVKKWLKFVLC